MTRLYGIGLDGLWVKSYKVWGLNIFAVTL
jgi:hypothetical protein